MFKRFVLMALVTAVMLGFFTILVYVLPPDLPTVQQLSQNPSPDNGFLLSTPRQHTQSEAYCFVVDAAKLLNPNIPPATTDEQSPHRSSLIVHHLNSIRSRIFINRTLVPFWEVEDNTIMPLMYFDNGEFILAITICITQSLPVGNSALSLVVYDEENQQRVFSWVVSVEN